MDKKPLTWRELLACAIPAHLLDEPALAIVQDPYGTRLAYPLTLEQNPHDANEYALVYDQDSDEYSIERNDEQLGGEFLRPLPAGLPWLFHDETVETLEELDEINAQLAAPRLWPTEPGSQPNPNQFTLFPTLDEL